MRRLYDLQILPPQQHPHKPSNGPTRVLHLRFASQVAVFPTYAHLPEMERESMNQPKALRGDRNQCPACNEYFNSTHAFEKHKTGDFGVNRRCLTPFEMTAKGMHVGSDGFWRGSRRDVESIPEAA